MNSQNALGWLNLALPAIIALYKETRAANPGQPALTDEQIFDLLAEDSAEVVRKADAFLAQPPSHPGI